MLASKLFLKVSVKMETSASSHNRQQLSNNSDDSDAALLPSNSVEIEPENYAKWRKNTTVAILCFINLINYMDRFTLAGKSKNIHNLKFMISCSPIP